MSETAPDLKSRSRLGVAGTERMLMMTIAAFRIPAVLRGVLVLAPGGHRPAEAVGFAAAATVSVALFLRAWHARRRSTGAESALEAGAAAALMLLSGLVGGDHRAHEWDQWTFPYALTVILAIGLAGRSQPFSLAAALGISAVHLYLCADFAVPVGDKWVLPVTAYCVNAIVSVQGARVLLGKAAALDAAHDEAEAAAWDEGRRQARSVWTGAVHDGVLQSLETMATGPWLDEPDLRRDAAAEAARLRSELTGDAGRQAPPEAPEPL